MTYRKLITLTESQNELLVRMMAEMYHSSASAFVIALMYEHEQAKRRTPGRPKGTSKDDEADDDDIQYVHPDKFVQMPYTYSELEAWAEKNKVKVPSRDSLKLYKGV